MFTIIIIALCLNLCHGTARVHKEIARKPVDNLNYKLTESVFPENYTLKISPHFTNNTFTGYIKICIHVEIPTNNITLHQKELNITKEKIFLTTMDDVAIQIKNAGISGTKEQSFYTVSFPEILKEKMYYLHIPEFYGVINMDNKGIYLGNYTDENGKLRKFATTSFEPTNARHAFPCFDEPSFRAQFKMYIVRPSHYNSLSNTKLVKSTMLNDDLYEDEFDVTVPMSTYLLVFVVSKMKLLPSRDNNFYRILARPEAINKGYGEHSLELGATILQTLENYFNVKYALNKMDQGAIPDEFFWAGAAESWGFVLYRESGLLVTPRTTTKKLMYLNTLIVHEFVHQWFGNLVSIKWWRYLWLKEGFAVLFESRIIDKVKPEWRQMEQFIVKEKQGVLESDSSNRTRSMNHDVGAPSEIMKLYDEMSYQKAACVIHMLETIMTPNAFVLGLTNYLQDRAFQSAIPMDLYRNFQRSLDDSAIKLPRNLSISKIMTTWDSQLGYPLIYVQRYYDINSDIVKLTQSSYVKFKGFHLKPTAWHVPINYATKSNPNFEDTQFSNWLLKPNETMHIMDLNPADWLIFNKQEAYYYRVNYDVTNWKLIAKALEENYRDIHILNRAQIIDDSFSLAKMDKLDFSIPLEISSYLHREDDYITQYAFLRNMIYIARILRGAAVEPYFQNFVIRTLKRSYKRLGNNPVPADTHIDKLHRVKVVSWMCKFNYSQCRANTWKTFDQWRKNNKSLVVDLENEIMCNAIRHGNEDDWNYLFQKSKTDGYVDFKMNAVESLGCTENASTLQHILDTSLNSDKYPLSQVVELISEKGLVGSQVAMRYVAENFKILCSKFPDSTILKLLETITSYFTTEIQFDKFSKLLTENGTLDSKFLTFLEEARSDVSTEQNHVQQISKFFYRHHDFITKRMKSGGKYRANPNIFAFNFYSSIVIIIYM